MVIATARPGVPVETLERALLEHLDRSAAEPVSATELERARNRMLTDYFSGLQKLDNRADLYSQLTTYFDDPGRVEEEAALYMELGAMDLMDYAARYFVATERVVVPVVPKEEG
jgi:zinc protease